MQGERGVPQVPCKGGERIYEVKGYIMCRI